MQKENFRTRSGAIICWARFRFRSVSRVKRNVVGGYPFGSSTSLLAPEATTHPPQRADGYMVILLKRCAGRTKAMRNFHSLETICSTLNYPVGVSINVAYPKLWLPELPPEIPSSFTLDEIAVALVDGKPAIQMATRKPGQGGVII